MNSKTSGHVVPVPRRWLVLLTVLGVLPWLVIAGVWSRDAARAGPDTIRSADQPLPAADRWGRLVVTPITISPPLEFVSRNWGPVQSSAWTFPNMAIDDVARLLADAGVSRDDVGELRKTVSPTPAVNGVSLTAPSEIVARMPPGARAKVYRWLTRAAVTVDRERTPINYDQFTSYRFAGRSLEEWLGTTGLRPETIDLVRRYAYPDGDFLYFADIERVRPAIADPEELQLLAKRLLRQRTAIVTLQIADATEVDAITEYWGRGGRRTDIRPLLESMVRFSQAGEAPSVSVDISHLLPQLARRLLYRFPRVTAEDAARPLLANCLWTALNFFADDPDDRYLDVPQALAHLKRDYYVVQDNFQLGDVVVFTDEGGNLVHAAVYLADGLVFGKNGTTPLAPWSIMPVAQLNGHYIEYADRWQASYFRRRDL